MENYFNNVEQRGSQESIETYKKLGAYLEQGYLLHGTKNQHEIIEPRQARDDNDKRTAGNLLGVYATKNLNIAVLMALFEKKDLSKNGWRSGYSGDENRLLVSGENYTFTTGYVHVLPQESFKMITDEHGSNELVSSETVVPTDVVTINPNILSLLKGVSIIEG